MQVFKLFFKVLKSYKGVILVYGIVSFAVAFLMTGPNSGGAAKKDADEMLRQTPVNIAVIDRDTGNMGEIVKEFVKRKNKIVDIEENDDAIAYELYWRAVDYVLIIPEGFEDELLAGKEPAFEGMSTPGTYKAAYFTSELTMYISKIKGLVDAGYTLDEAVKLLDEIGKEQLLSDEQERELSAKILSGDQRALSRLVEANLRFVVTVARQYKGKGVAMEDLVSEGNIGLMKAATKFDATKGVRFVNYAVVYIRQAIEKAIDQQAGLYQVPKDVKEEAARQQSIPLSVDAPLGHRTNMSLLSVLVNQDAPLADERIHSEAIENAVEFALGSLDKRESQVVNAYFGIGQEHETMAEIAEDMELKRERVRQIRDKAVRKLRKAYKSHLRELRK